MTLLSIPARDWFQIVFFFAVLLALAAPLGRYIAGVFEGQASWVQKRLAPVENGFYRVMGISPQDEMDWKTYAGAALAFSFVCLWGLYAVLRMQGLWAPDGMGAPSPSLAFNIAVSFVTNTNWQAYTPEKEISGWTNALGLTVQNFLSPAVGLAVLMAVIRGFSRQNATLLGSFWVDVVRGLLYILLPLSLLLGFLLVTQGVVQSLPALAVFHLWETPQALHAAPLGFVASQTAIAQLGSNGGSPFLASAAHPFQNPTPLSFFLELLAILLIPAALPFTFGKIVGEPKQGRTLLLAMLLLFVPLFLVALSSEQAGNPLVVARGAVGGNMEGKEIRFGLPMSVLWSVATAATSNGSTAAAMDSLMPLAGAVPLLLIQMGEVVFGGVGSGLYGLLVFSLFAVFLAGLMVGRTPEYLGKKIGVFDVKVACLAILAPSIAVLIGTAIAVLSIPPAVAGAATTLNAPTQNFVEILYAFSSAANNNGSAMAGLEANTVFYNVALAICMLIGRFIVLVSVLALAGSLASKNRVPASSGTLETTSPLFVVFLAMIVVMVGMLTFVPSLALGPLAEHEHLKHQSIVNPAPPLKAVTP